MLTPVIQNWILRVNNDVLHRSVDDGIVSLVKWGNEDFFFEIWGPAAKAWNMINGSDSLQTICNNLAQNAELSQDEIENALEKITHVWIYEGLVTPVNCAE